MSGLRERYRNLSRRQRQSLWINISIGLGVFLIIISLMSLVKVKGYRVYKDPVMHFTVHFPEEWKAVPVIDPGDPTVGFRAPAESNLDQFAENVSVVQQLLEDGDTLQKYTVRAVKQIKMTFQNFIEIKEHKTYKVDGYPAFMFGYQGLASKSDNPIRYLHIWTIKGNHAYILTYTAEVQSYDKFYDDAMSVIRSFKFN